MSSTGRRAASASVPRKTAFGILYLNLPCGFAPALRLDGSGHFSLDFGGLPTQREQKRGHLVIFYLLTTAIACVGWIPFAAYQVGILHWRIPAEIPIVVQYSPTLAAFILIAIEGGRGGLWRFLKSFAIYNSVVRRRFTDGTDHGCQLDRSARARRQVCSNYCKPSRLAIPCRWFHREVR